MFGGVGGVGGVVLCCVLLCSFVVRGDDVILPPPASSGDASVGIVVIHDVDIEADAYVALMQTIAGHLSIFSISGWVSIPDFEGNLTTSQTGDLISSCQQQLLQAGMPADSTLILVGHGWGGFSTQDYLHSTSGNVSWTKGITGHVLLGSYIQRKYDHSLPVPTITFGGELDGVFRITRTMEAQYYYSLHHGFKDFSNMVTVVEGLNHVGYLNISISEIPQFYLENDLKSELDAVLGYKEIAQTFSAYVSNLLKLEKMAVTMVLERAAQEAAAFLAPLKDAFQQEGYYFFLPPCDGPYSQKGNTKCVKSCPTTPQAQTSLCGLDDININVNDAFHSVSQFYPVDYLPNIDNTCSAPTPDCTLNITTVSENFYYEDSVYNPVSAYEIAGKMKSRQSCYAASGIKKPSFKELDGPSLCGEFNQKLYDTTTISMPLKTMKRHQQYGIDMKMTQDKVITAFPAWSGTPMMYNLGQDDQGQEILEVTAIALTTSTSNLASPGYHFCSILSPGRVAEWVYVDSLRYHYSLGAQ